MNNIVLVLSKIHNLEYIQNKNRNISILWNISIYLEYIQKNSCKLDKKYWPYGTNKGYLILRWKF
jgi:hypothetical protein